MRAWYGWDEYKNGEPGWFGFTVTVAVVSAVVLILVLLFTKEADAAPFRPCKEANIVGTPFNDFLVGTALRDVIRARGGNDRILGLGGADIICGNGGNDHIDGGDGSASDFAYGGLGHNKCSSIEIESGC